MGNTINRRAFLKLGAFASASIFADVNLLGMNHPSHMKSVNCVLKFGSSKTYPASPGLSRGAPHRQYILSSRSDPNLSWRQSD